MSETSRCRETAGFLFAHPCKRAAESTCPRCSKPICSQHTRDRLCIGCFKQEARRNSSDPYLMSSFYYSDYDDLDREAFTPGQTQSGPEGELEGDFDGT